MWHFQVFQTSGHTVVCLLITKLHFLCASPYIVKEAHIEIGHCMTSVVGLSVVTKVDCVQMVHPRPIVTTESLQNTNRNPLVICFTLVKLPANTGHYSVKMKISSFAQFLSKFSAIFSGKKRNFCIFTAIFWGIFRTCTITNITFTVGVGLP